MNRKTLVCVVNVRGREHEVTWNNFKKNVLDSLNADLAICMEPRSNLDFTDPFWKNSKYIWFSPKFQNWFDAIEYARQKDFPDADPNYWKKFAMLPGNAFHPLNNWDGGFGAIQTFLKWYLWYNIRKENIFSQYDRIVLTRTDFNFLSPHPPMDILEPEYIWLPDGQHHTGYCDRHAVLSEQNAESFFSILKNMLVNTDELFNRLYVPPHLWRHSDGPHIEKLYKTVIDYELGEDSVRGFPYIMHLVREPSWPDFAGTPFREDLGFYVRSQEEFESAQHFQTIYKTTEDWYTKGF
jgi:hypothetical protein